MNIRTPFLKKRGGVLLFLKRIAAGYRVFNSSKALFQGSGLFALSDYLKNETAI